MSKSEIHVVHQKSFKITPNESKSGANIGKFQIVGEGRGGGGGGGGV